PELPAPPRPCRPAPGAPRASASAPAAGSGGCSAAASAGGSPPWLPGSLRPRIGNGPEDVTRVVEDVEPVQRPDQHHGLPHDTVGRHRPRSSAAVVMGARVAGAGPVVAHHPVAVLRDGDVEVLQARLVAGIQIALVQSDVVDCEPSRVVTTDDVVAA